MECATRITGYVSFPHLSGTLTQLLTNHYRIPCFYPLFIYPLTDIAQRGIRSSNPPIFTCFYLESTYPLRSLTTFGGKGSNPLWG